MLDLYFISALLIQPPMGKHGSGNTMFPDQSFIVLALINEKFEGKEDL